MPNTYFSFKQFTVHQQKAAMKVTTDSCILGAYASHENPGRILDIGTGTGLLAMMVAQRYPASTIDAVETDPDAIDQAAENFSQCPWPDRLNLHAVSIQEFTKISRPVFDLILCNPPYYKKQFRSPDDQVNIARHATRLSLAELAHLVVNLLSTTGSFYVILPPGSFMTIGNELAISGLYLSDRLLIYNMPGKPLYRVIGGFNRQQKEMTEKKLLIMNSKNKYTAGFKHLLRDFYLDF